MLNVLLAILDKYMVLFAKAPALQKAIELLRTILAKIDVLHPQQESDNTGVRMDREDIREELSELSQSLAGIIYNYAIDTSNLELAQQYNLNKTDFTKATLTNYKKLIHMIGGKLRELGDKLYEYGISAETIAEFDTLEKDYFEYETKPREATVVKTAATVSLASLFDEIQDILENRIDKLVLQFKKTNPEFYTEYTNARNEIENPHHRTKAEQDADKAAKQDQNK